MVANVSHKGLKSPARPAVSPGADVVFDHDVDEATPSSSRKTLYVTSHRLLQLGEHRLNQPGSRRPARAWPAVAHSRVHLLLTSLSLGNSLQNLDRSMDTSANTG